MCVFFLRIIAFTRWTKSRMIIFPICPFAVFLTLSLLYPIWSQPALFFGFVSLHLCTHLGVCLHASHFSICKRLQCHGGWVTIYHEGITDSLSKQTLIIRYCDTLRRGVCESMCCCGSVLWCVRACNNIVLLHHLCRYRLRVLQRAHGHQATRQDGVGLT